MPNLFEAEILLEFAQKTSHKHTLMWYYTKPMRRCTRRGETLMDCKSLPVMRRYKVETSWQQEDVTYGYIDERNTVERR